MAGFSTTIYNAVFRRTSTMALAVMGSVFFFERTFDLSAEAIFEGLNKGKLYKDMKPEEE